MIAIHVQPVVQCLKCMTSALAWYGNGADVQVHEIFYINVGPSEQAAQWYRVHGQKFLMPLQFAFSALEDGNGDVVQSPQFSAMNAHYKLPIVTVQVTTESFLAG
ncbi:unnamed protein product [Sphagnum jensenii]